MRHAAEGAIDGSRDTLENTLMYAKDIVRRNPLASMAAVATIAYLWGRMK
jgi:hypothetical protein